MSLGFYVNMNDCIGCRTCQVACKDRHDLQMAGPRPRRVESFECGTYPEVGFYTMTVSCNHCENPACTAACPTGAMYKDPETGIVLHDDELCIRCQSCVNSCPYGAPQYVEADDLILKCDSCKALREAGGIPACVASCPMRAIEFGEIDELLAAHPEATVQLPCLPDASQTTPNAIWEPNAAATMEEFTAVVM